MVVSRVYSPERAQQLSVAHKKRSEELKREVIEMYGGKCGCCGEINEVFLTVDHIEDNGAEHRRIIARERGTKKGPTGFPFYRWLRENNWPNGYRILCFNCNFAIHRDGSCPHQTP